MSNETCGGTSETQGRVTPIAWCISIVVTLVGACLLAMSMVMQRYALSYPEPRVPFGRFRVPKCVAWLGGLVLYTMASGAKILGFNLGPMTVLASVFTSLLVFNLIFARWLLHEEITPPKVGGALLILVGACVCTASVPSDAPTSFKPEEVGCLFEASPPGGLNFVCAALFILALGAGAIFYAERAYPRDPAIVAPSTSPPAAGTAAPAVAPQPEASSEVATTPSPTVAASSTPGPVPRGRAGAPAWLEAAMAIIYPATLGLDEAMSDLFVRAYSSMLAQCTNDDEISCHHYALYVCVPGGCIAGLISLALMRVTFARYDTTVALPIECAARPGPPDAPLLAHQPAPAPTTTTTTAPSFHRNALANAGTAHSTWATCASASSSTGSARTCRGRSWRSRSRGLP